MGGGTNIKEKGGEGGGIGRGSIGLGITIVKGGTSPWQIPVHLGLLFHHLLLVIYISLFPLMQYKILYQLNF